MRRGRCGEWPVRVAFWAGSFERAGTQQFLVEFLRRLDRERFDPVILSTLKTGELLGDIDAMGIEVHQFKTGRHLLSVETLRSLSGAARFLRRERVAVLNCMLGVTTLFGPLIGRLAGVPVVFNNQRNLSYWMRGRYKNAVYGFVNRHVVDRILVNSDAARAELEERFAVRPAKIVAVGTGVDLARIDAAAPNVELISSLGLTERPKIGIVAKLSWIKGHRYLLDAMPDVLSRHPDAVLMIIGDGPLRALLEARAEELDISGSVFFVGARDDVPSLLKALDIFVLASTSEGSPNAVLEAMAARLPVVATAVGGVPEMLMDGGSGILVPPKDPRAIASALSELLDDRARAASMGRAGREAVEREHDLDLVIRRTEGVFEAELRRRRCVPSGPPSGAARAGEEAGESR